MKRIFFSLTIAFLAGAAVAQGGFGPNAGDKSFALKLGRAVDYGDLNSNEINQLGTTNYNSQPYTLANSSYGSNNAVNIIGLEAKYFFSSNIAVSMSGSGVISSSPAQDQVDGVNSGSSIPGTSVPTYAMLSGRTTKQFYFNTGANYYLSTGVSRLFPYAGLEFNSVYGQMEIFDGYKGTTDTDNYDTRRGEFYGLGGSIVGGIDYYLAEGLFFGFEVRVASYMKNVKRLYPQPGLEAQEAVTLNTSFLSYPSIKLGFKF